MLNFPHVLHFDLALTHSLAHSIILPSLRHATRVWHISDPAPARKSPSSAFPSSGNEGED